MAYQKDGIYSDDAGETHPIRLTTQDYAAGGTPATGTATSGISAEVSTNRRKLGLHPRYVLLGRTRGTAPDQFTSYKRLVILTLAAFGTAAFNKGATVTINSVAWTVKDKVGEKEK